VHGEEHTTYQSAAIALHLVEHHNEGEICFVDAINNGNTPYELRTMFISLTLSGFPTYCIYNKQNLRDKMCEDYLYETQGNTVLAYNKLLQYFSNRLRQENKDNTHFGLPEPEESYTELQIEKLKYDPQQQQILYEQLLKLTPPTEQQLLLLNDIKHCLAHNINKTYIIQGQGGSGKTAISKLIIAYARSQGHLVQGCASTAFAASNYKDFYTAHSLFEIPVVDDIEAIEEGYDHRSNLDKKPQRLELLMNTRVIVWDEISNQNIIDFMAAYKALDSFKNHIVLIEGDKNQTAPVVERGTKQQIIESSIYCSDVIKTFHKITFSTNLRLVGNTEQSQIDYAKLLLEVANGNHFKNKNELFTAVEVNENGDDIESGIKTIALQTIGLFTETEHCLSWLYPNGFDPLNMHRTCILAVTNKQVEEWNSQVQKLNENTSTTLKSYDSFNEVDDPHDYLKEMVTEHVMNSFNDNQAPTHILELKKDDICILLANFDKEQGLTKNTRVKIVLISNRYVRVVTLNNEYPVFANIPRFNFHIKLPFNKSFKILRRQFPLKLAYALTINRSQGQEFDRQLVDLTNAAFSHGHLYVALSRIRKSSNIKIYCYEEQIWDLNVVFTKNVVYDEILKSF
jgi:hypothetical protein